MEILSDNELVAALNMATIGEPLCGTHHTVQVRMLAGLPVSTMCEGRMVRMNDLFDNDQRAQRFFAQWTEQTKTTLSDALAGRITVESVTTWINGGYGDPSGQLQGRTGKYITILLYAALRTIASKGIVECTQLVGEDARQWRLVLLNTPIVGLLVFPGIQCALSDLAVKEPVPQHIQARNQVVALPAIKFSRNAGVRQIIKKDQTPVVQQEPSEEIIEVAVVERQSIISEETDDLSRLLDACPTRVQLEYNTLKILLAECRADRDRLNKELKIEKKNNRELQERINKEHDDYKIHMKDVVDLRLTMSESKRKGLTGEKHVLNLLDIVLRGKFPVISVRTDADQMDLHVVITPTSFIAVEVKLCKNTISSTEIQKFYDNVVTLSERKDDKVLIGAVLVSLTSTVAGFGDADFVMDFCQKTHVKTWFVNKLLDCVSPADILKRVFSQMSILAMTFKDGILFGRAIERGEEVQIAQAVEKETVYSKICEALQLPCVSAITAGEVALPLIGAAVQTAIDLEGRVATQSGSASEGVIIRTLLDSVAHQAHVQIQSANGDGGTLQRDSITGAMVASACDAATGEMTESVLVKGRMRQCGKIVSLLRDIPIEYHKVFNVKIPFGDGVHSVVKAIIKVCDPCEDSSISRKTLVEKLFANGLAEQDERIVRHNMSAIIFPECLLTENRRVKIRGLKFKRGMTE